MRNPPPRNLALESLLEERDHLKIEANLLELGPRPNLAELELIHAQLEEIERRISQHQTVY
jgi:hypothetical protein